VTDLKGTTFSLKLKVVDVAGNVSCYQTSFSIDNVVEIVNLTRDKSLFSPNGDGILDDLNINYQIDEYAVVDVKVFKLIKKADDSYTLDSTPVRTIVSGLKHLAGTENTSWDGKGDSGSAVPDGKYGIAVFATDSCGNTRMRWVSSEIDNTPPTTVITYPRPPDPLGNIVEVKGTADDLHFQSYILEAGQGDSPAEWFLVSLGTNPVKDNILGKWNTFGRDGRWTLRLSATDTVGNKNITTVTIDLGVRKNLIKDLDVTPKLFSANNDGKLDTTNIKYELTDACQVKIDILDSGGVVKKTYTTTTSSAGTYTYTWDGKDNAGVIVSDGAYTVQLTATLSSNTSVTQTEAITVTVDSTPPTVDIKQPLDNSYIKTDVSVNGTISDKNLLEYSINYTGDSGTTLLDQGNQNRENYTFGILNEPPEGKYILNVKAKDLGENITEKNITFTIDRTPPKVTFDTPKEGEYYGSEKNIINITGSIVEKNLEIYNLRYGPGENPAQWIELQSGNTIPADPQLFSWKVGKNDGIPDGLYTLSLYAKDKAGLEAENKVKVKIDNTPPEVALTSPKDGDYIRSAVEIKGTAYDSNLDKYTLEISEGKCDSAFKWAVIKTSTTSVKDGLLAFWQTLPPDGDYCLRLTAIDKLENKAEAKVNVKVDTHPPPAPVLSGKIEDKTNARLNWTKNTEPDLAGYNLYRDIQKINTELIKDTSYLDQNLKEGIYIYTVKAIDLAGNESEPSNEVKLKVDLTGPDARIRSPQDGSKVSGLIDIKGTAYSEDDFKEYRVYIGQGSSPTIWNLIRTSPVPIPYDTLSQWDTIGLPEGSQYSIKLDAEDINGNINTHQITVTIDNTPPLAPVLISAIPNGSDVTLKWQANKEPDLAGYLLYRNDQLANVSGIVIGDLKPYLITGTTYLDKALPDGRFRYYLIAMDQAGNMSDQSNTLEVDIDTHPPKATIVDPLDKSKFEDKTLVKAESPDLDIASVQFQYKRAQDTTWINLGSPVTQIPYITYLDPITLGMSYGDYHLRAVATDKGAKTDPAPSYITVTYTDLTAPDTPIELKALTDGKDVTLTWKANTETDLDGYNIYRTSGNTKAKINTSIVKGMTYQDKDLSGGTYTYEVTALDTYGNESKPSNSASAKIYAPSIAQPYTPKGQKTIAINGSNAEAGSTVEIFVEDVAGYGLRGTTTSDSAGNFTLDINLTLGENRITAKATDSAGNISRASDLVVVVYNEPPSAPTGLAANINGYDVNLTWNPNTEQDLSGYNLYRDGEKVNVPVDQTSGNTIASSSYYNNPPSKAFDSDTSTYWMSPYGYGTFIPVWWEIDLPSPELINHLEIQWESESYAGRTYEIQLWSGYAWITQTKVTENNTKDNTFDFKPPYRTDKIRIYITDTTDTNYSKQVGISEVKILKDNLITEASYSDTNLDNGKYNYRVDAVDYYGFESLPSDEIKAIVGDVIPPSEPLNLTASSSGSDIILNWSSNTEPDLASYNIYRNTTQGWLKINTSLITGTTYTDSNLSNGTYTYRVTALDNAQNESLPSNEASATVYITPPQPPINLIVTSVPEGGTLKASWEYTGIASGYNLYRGTVSGGPYTKVNSSLITNTSYLDSGLTNGVDYYYVVVAVDPLGNESAYSNEAMGIPSDTILPSKPKIFFPTVSGIPVVVYKDKTDISGSAEMASTIELFKNGISVGKTTAFDKDIIQISSLDHSAYEASLSPDGKRLAYEYNGSIWLKTLDTDNTIQIILKGYSPIWSPDGRRLVYIFWDSNWNDRIGIYDIETGSSTPLTDYTDAYEYSPSWSFDGNRVAFVSNRGGSDDVWIKDLATGTLTQITNNIYASNPKLSPDGKKVAYFEYPNLYIVDITSGNTIQVDTQDEYPIDWSSDSKGLTFVSYRNGNGDIFVLDINTQNQIQITDSASDEFNPVWSPDGRSIAFIRWENNESSIWTAPSNKEGQPTLLQQNLYDLSYLSWVKSGGIAYIDQSVLNIQYLKGHFSFKDIQLSDGENIFSATAIDSSGYVSQPSDEISVIFDAALMPDLETTTDDIYIYPPYPITGEEVAINVVVWNKGQLEVRDVEMDLYLWDSSGNLELLKSEKIPYIASNSGEVVGASWNSASMLGINTVIAVIDPEDKIHEFDETNNFAIKEIVVTSAEGISMTTSLDRDQYQASQDVNIHINLRNSGMEKDVTVLTSIEDENGNIVTSLNPISTSLPYATQKDFDLIWNTSSTYAGSYRVHTVLKDNPDILTENITPFSILPDINIDSSITTDKANYGPREDVSVSIQIKSSGKNYIIPELIARVKITDTNNNILFTEDKKLTNLLPDATNTINSIWNTGISAPGIYNASVEIYINNAFISTKATSFTIDPVLIITGNITATPSVVIFANNVQIDYTVQNSGNVGINGLPLKVIITDPESQGVMNTGENIIDLQIDGSHAGKFIFSTQGYDLKNYLVILQYSYQGNTKNISSTSFTVKDGTPPVVNIISPVSGSYYNSKFDLAVTATDDASGVDRVEYQIDSGAWRLLPVSDLSSGRYSTTWIPTKAEEGTHTIGFRATDKAGNTSRPVSTNITIDLTPPAPPIITSPPDNSFVSSNIVDIKGIAEPGSMVKMVFAGTFTTQADPITGEFVFKGVRLNTGQNSFIFTAEDRVGNISGPTGYTLHLDISAWLSGTITASPNPVYQGKDETILYTITNKGYGDINNLNVKVVITDSGTSDVKQTFEKTVNIPANTTITGNFLFSTSNLTSKTYQATLQVYSAIMPQPKTLASTSFEVKSGIEVTKTIPDVANLLVWVNDECEEDSKQYTVDSRQGQNSSQKENDHDHEKKECIRIDLPENILRDVVTSYFIVYDKKDFEKELRNPYYTDILILGDHHPLEDHYPDELRDQVYSGKGLISVLYLKHGEHHEGQGEDEEEYDPLFGLRYKGHISGDEHLVNILNSPISEAGTLIAKGEALKVEVDDINRVVAWIEGTYHSKSEKYSFDSPKDRPGIVLNTYGLGKTIFYAFDLGLTLNDENYSQIATLIKNSIAYIHRPQDTTAFHPNQLIPVEIKIKSLGGAFDLRITETYPADLKIYDPFRGEWITENPWVINTYLNHYETKTILYYALTPDRTGTYTLKTEAGYIENGIYNFYQNLSIDIVVGKSSASTTADILTALKALPVSGKEKAKVNDAIKYIEDVQKRVIQKEEDIEKNIHDILKAIDALLSITGVDISSIRLMMDEILIEWESRYYFGLA
jgi:Tol biopolymer transport system component/flagellar hook assembly protein FlgD